MIAAYYTRSAIEPAIILAALIGLFLAAWLDGLTAGRTRPTRPARPRTSPAAAGRVRRVVGPQPTRRDGSRRTAPVTASTVRCSTSRVASASERRPRPDQRERVR